MFTFKIRTNLLIFGCAVFALLTMITLLLFVTKNNENPSDDDAELLEPSVATSSVVEAPQPRLQSTLDSVLVEETESVDPRIACKDPLGELSDECMKSLDAYFWERPFVWNGFDWTSVAMSYSRIFEALREIELGSLLLLKNRNVVWKRERFDGI